MKNSKRRANTVMTLATLALFASCGPGAKTGTEASETSTPTPEGVTFGDGFYKEELAKGTTLRWVRQEATLHLQAPADGSYRLGFHLITAFNTKENVITVTVNGHPAGTLTTNVPDFANPPNASITTTLRAGDNSIVFKSNQPEVSFGANDPRKVAFGLVDKIDVQPAQ